MKMAHHKFAIAAYAVLAAPLALAGTPNTIQAGHVPYEVGQKWISHHFDANAPERWFSYGEIGGRSYCVEATQGPASPVQLDPVITVYADTTTTTPLTVEPNATPVASDNAGGDPHYSKGARACYISEAPFGTTAVRSFKVSASIAPSSTDNGFLRVRVVDTALDAPCHAIGGNVNIGRSARFQTYNSTGTEYRIAARFIYANALAASQSGTLLTWRQLEQSVRPAQSGVGGLGGCMVAHNAPLGVVSGRVISTLDNVVFTTENLVSR